MMCQPARAVSLELREPAYHLGEGRGAIHGAALVDADRGAFGRVRQVEEGLPGKEALAIDRATGHPADGLAGLIHDRVAVVSHADALVIEPEPHNDTFAFLLTLHEGLAAYEPRFVNLHIRAEAAFGNAQIARIVLAGAVAHLVPIERQAGLGAEGIAGAKTDGLEA